MLILKNKNHLQFTCVVVVMLLSTMQEDGIQPSIKPRATDFSIAAIMGRATSPVVKHQALVGKLSSKSSFLSHIRFKSSI